jgi:uncharacterized protein (TIGR02001 family)
VNIIQRGILISALFTTPTAYAYQISPFDPSNFSANVALSTNYVDRGISLSGNDPSISGGFEWFYRGFYLGVWAATIESVETENLEVDYYAGYAGDWGSYSYTLDMLYYDYPNEAKRGDPEDIGPLGFFEYGASITRSFDGDFQPNLGGRFLYTTDGYAESGSALLLEGQIGCTMPFDILLNLAVGQQRFEKKYVGIDDYLYYNLTLTKSLAGMDVTLGYTDTDDKGEMYQGSETGDLYLTLSRVF